MTPDNPSPLQFLRDGRVCLPSNADPAAAGTVVYGWVAHRVGLDLGRGGSVDLNRFRAFFKWSSALDYAATGTGNSWLK